MKHLKAIFVILFVLLIIIIAVQNYEAFSTTVKFKVDLIFASYESNEMSLYFVAVITFLIGILFAGFYGIAERFKLKNQIRDLMKGSKEKEEELNSLRNLPLTGDDMESERESEV